MQKACLYNCIHRYKWKYLAQKLVTSRTWKLFYLFPFYSLWRWNFLLVTAVPSVTVTKGKKYRLVTPEQGFAKKKIPSYSAKTHAFPTAAEMQNRWAERKPERTEFMCAQAAPSSGCIWAALSHNKKPSDTSQAQGRTCQGPGAEQSSASSTQLQSNNFIWAQNGKEQPLSEHQSAAPCMQAATGYVQL